MPAEAHVGPSRWPLLGTVALFLLAVGAVNLIQGHALPGALFAVGAGLLAWMLYGWFATVIREAGAYSDQVDRSLRWGMAWFIFSEVALFAAFFAALVYSRWFAVPWLGGAGDHDFTRALLWPDFQPAWPLLQTPDPGSYTQPQRGVKMLGVPLVITLVLLASAYAVTWAQWGIQRGRRRQLLGGLVTTILLGLVFLGFQLREYWINIHQFDLTLSSGIYGSTFFMLTGFHSSHVTIGLIVLLVMLRRALRGDFSREDHFAFEAAAWYWHFVDVIWLWLFVLVYWF